MFQQQSFGHFGAPDALSADYGVTLDQYDKPESSGGYDQTGQYDMTQDLQSSSQTTQVDVSKILTSGYKRNGKKLPFIKGGATDAVVKSATGIEGLITEIKASMKALGVSVSTGAITDAEIKAFQKKKGLTQDGVIGEKTYEKLGFTAPFPTSSSGGSTYNPSTDTAIAKPKFYQQKWFQYSAIALVVAATGLVLFYPRGEE